MSTTTTARRNAGHLPNLSFGGELRSEWIKLRTLRSTLWCYVIIVVLTIGLGLLIASALPVPTGAAASTTATHDVQQSTWVTVSTLGISFAQLVSAVLGALVITGEYGTGMIRSTFAAVPKRLPAVVAKALVFGVTTFLVSLVALVATALVTAPLLPAKNITPDFGDGKIWLALVGGAGYVALIGLLAFGIGLIIRNSAGGIAAALGLVLVVPTIFQVLSLVTRAEWPANIAAFLPSSAGAKLYAYPGAVAESLAPSRPGSPAATAASAVNTITLDSWQGLLVLLGWVVVAFIIGAILVKRRDA
ncbi:MAG: ABC transporter permease subunit [Pseudolysinimonas sp.]